MKEDKEREDRTPLVMRYDVYIITNYMTMMNGLLLNEEVKPPYPYYDHSKVAGHDLLV